MSGRFVNTHANICAHSLVATAAETVLTGCHVAAKCSTPSCTDCPSFLFYILPTFPFPLNQMKMDALWEAPEIIVCEIKTLIVGALVLSATGS